MAWTCGPATPMSSPRPVTPSSAVGMPDRPADASGGPVPGGRGRYIPRFDDVPTRTREDVNRNDTLVQHERIPYYDQDYLGSHHDSLVNWTDCGPVRPSLHMRQVTVRRLVGTSATRNFDPRPVAGFGSQDQGHGMHTNPVQPKTGVNKNFRSRAQQIPTRVNRLSPSVYSGQSYSRTTVVQGGQHPGRHA